MKKNNYARLTATILFFLILFLTRSAFSAPPIHVHAHVKPPEPGTGELYLKVEAPATDTFAVKLFTISGAQLIQINVTGGENLLPSLPVGNYTFEMVNSSGEIVENGKFRVNIPPSKPKPEPGHDSRHVHAHVKGTHLKEILILHVHKSLNEIFALTIYDSAGIAIHNLSVTGGENVLPELPLGSYSFNLKDSAGVIVETGKFRIKQPHVHAHVKGHYYGDTLILHVHADTNASFILSIINDFNKVIQTLAVKGGENILPELPLGHYSFILKDEDSIQVEEGKFSVRIRPVHTGIHPTPSNAGEASVFVDAPVTESFTLMIYDKTSALLQTTTVTGGASLLPALTSGIYYYKVINSEGHEVSHGKILIQ
jgi:hypothetical protein